MVFRKCAWAALAALLLLPGVALGQQTDTRFPPADILEDEGGPVRVEGVMNYTNLLLAAGVAQPIVLLEDQAGFVTRDKTFLFPLESQVLGNFTTDFFTPPVNYSISLPIEPAATLVDVDNDDNDDTGVMIYTPAYWTNIFGDPFLERRDIGGGGWSGAYAGTIVQPFSGEIVGGTYIVYAPDDQQGFPSGFGDDGLLFTEDDPIVGLPTGYTVVSMDSDPFTFSRPRVARIDLLEPTLSAVKDYSALPFVEAFDEMIAMLRREYAFTEYKGVDWDVLVADYRPLVETAQQRNDDVAFARAVFDLFQRIPDGHLAVFGDGARPVYGQVNANIIGDPGFALVELSDGRFVAGYILPSGPAQQAGMKLGAEVTAIDGTPIAEAVNATAPPYGPFSTPHNLRLAQVQYVTRFAPDRSVDVTFVNPSDAERTVTLRTARSVDSLFETPLLSFSDSFVAPVTFELLPEGYAYVAINSFFENEVLTVQSWEYFLTLVNDEQAAGVIIDLRQNGGGSGLLANQMAGYFYAQDTAVGRGSAYDEEIDAFYEDEESQAFVYVAPEPFRYSGPIVVLVGPQCASACESFAYNLSLLDQVTIVGYTPTSGLGGGISDFLMPAGLRVRYTFTRILDIEGNIKFEGIGIVPDVTVPVTEAVFNGAPDPLLEAAFDVLGRRR